MASNKIHITREQQQRYDLDESRAMDPADDCGYQVELFVYDLTRGLARTLSPALLGKQIDGVWHTGIVAYGREYFFGSAGIESCKPGGTILGEPDRIVSLGESQVPYQLFLEYIFGLGESAYRPGAYDLLKHNCNNFSDDIAQFLCGCGVPKAILQLPEELLSTPLGISLNELLKTVELKHANSRSINFGPLSSTLGPAIQVVRTSYEDPEFDALNDAIDQVRYNSLILEERRNSLNDKLSKKERKEKRRERRERKEKRRKERSETSEERRLKKKKGKPPLPGPSGSSSQAVCSSSSQCEVQDVAEQSEEVTTQDHAVTELDDSDVNSASDRVNSLRLAEEVYEEDATDSWQPVDDFWGTQRDDSPCGRVGSFSQLNDAIDPPAEYSDNACSPADNEGDRQQDIHTDNPQSDALPLTDDAVDMEDAPASDGSPPQQPPSQPVPPETESSPVPEVEREPPILFKDAVDARRDFDELVGCCMHMLSTEEQQHMEELRSYVVEDDGAWALGENFGDLFARIFHDANFPEPAKYHLVRILAVAALKDDVILLLHQDRKDHTIMNFVNKIEHLSPEIQEAIALFFCNMFEHLSPSEWLLYISEWNTESPLPISNIRVTTKVAVNALLHSNDKVQNYGTALMYNLGTKEVKTVVFDDVAPELAMAILQYLSSPRVEELLWRALTALCRFCYASSEVPSLIKMIGPEPNTFRGTSERIDTVIEEINAKLSRVRLF